MTPTLTITPNASLTPELGLTSSAIVQMVTERFGPRLALTLDEVAQLLPIGRSTVYDLAASGALPLIEGCGRKMVSLSALIEWLHHGGSPAAPEAAVTAYGLRKRGTWRPAA